MQTWKLEVTLKVDDSWVADGFNPKERLSDIEEKIAAILPYAYGSEVKVKVAVKAAPKASVIKALQG